MARRILRLLIVITIVAGFATTSFAGGGILGSLAASNGFAVGPVKLHAGLQVSQEMNSNIYTTTDNEVDDHITVLSPGMLLTMQTQRHKLNLGVASDTSQYADNDDENFTSVTYKAGYGLQTTTGIAFDISDAYETSEDPRPEQNAPERKKHFTNRINTSLVYTFPAKKFSTEVFAKEFHLEYDEDVDKEGNRKDREFGVGLYYRVLPKTSLLLEYSYGDKEYIDKAVSLTDSRSNYYRLGIKWDATAKMSGAVKVGYEDRTYSELDRDKSYAPVIDGSVAYKITEQTSLKALVNISIMETSYAGSSDYSSSYYYVQQKLGVGIISRLMNRFTIDITASVSSDEYENLQGGSFESRKDTTHNFAASAGYDFNKNFNAGIKYSGKSKESNDPNHGETTHKASVYVRYVI